MKFLIDTDWEDFNSPDEEPITKEQEDFAEELFNFLQELVNKEENLTEEFISNSTLNRHFYKHSLANRNDKKSNRQTIWYDFKYINEYKNYEELISEKVIKTKYQIPSLLDTNLITNYTHELFKGNTSILFTTSCGFTNAIGKIMIGLYAYSTDVTTNYTKGNTVSVLILSPTGKTLSLYSVDANYLENKLNSLIKKYSSTKTKLNFNR